MGQWGQWAHDGRGGGGRTLSFQVCWCSRNKAKIKLTYMSFTHTHTHIHARARANPIPFIHPGVFAAIQDHFQHSVTPSRVAANSEVAPVSLCCNALLGKHLLVQVVHQLSQGVHEWERRIQQSTATCSSMHHSNIQPASSSSCTHIQYTHTP